MKVTLKPLKGDTFEVEYEPENTVLELKSKIAAAKPDMPVEKQKLILAGKILADDTQMKEYDIKETSFIVIMVQKDKAAPAPAPTPSPAPAPSPTAPTEGATNAPDIQARAESAMPTNVGGFQKTIDDICAMGFAKEDVERCVRAAFGNADRAVEYLMSGIPDSVTAGMGGDDAPTAPPPAPGTAGPPSAGGLAFPAIPPPSATGGGGGGDLPPALAQLRSNPQFGQLAQMVAQNPALLQQMLPALAGSYPEIAEAVQQHPEQFMRMLQEAAVSPGTSPAPGGGPPGGMPNGAMLAQLAQNPEMLQQLISEIQQTDPEMAAQIQANPQAFAAMMQQMAASGGGMPGMGGPPPGQQVVQLTPEEGQAVQRLTELGFDRNMAVQAYLACDKNEELAANFLFEQGLGD